MVFTLRAAKLPKFDPVKFVVKIARSDFMKSILGLHPQAGQPLAIQNFS
jgi:hypothetical protein